METQPHIIQLSSRHPILMSSHIRPWEQSPVDTQMAKIIAILLNSQDYHFTEEFLSQVFELTTEYMNHLLGNLLEYTQLQRRRKPGLSDIKIVLEEDGILPNILADQVQFSKNFPNKHKQRIQAVITKDQEAFTNNNISSNEQYAITEVVPNIKTKPPYIPAYLPDLPPDYTYQSTPTFSQPLTDLKQLRTKLVQESRLTEESLYKLIESDTSELKKRLQFEEELMELMKNKLTDDLQGEVTTSVENEKAEKLAGTIEETNQPSGTVEGTNQLPGTVEGTNQPSGSPLAAPFKFDFVKYAQQRKALALRKKAELEEAQKKRDADVFMKAELYYSPYATEKPTRETDKYFKDLLNDEFKKVIVSVRLAEEMKQRETAERKELKEKQEKEFKEQNEIQFNFQQRGAIDSSDIDSDAMEDF